MANKTLCCAIVNREKGKRTPREAFGHDRERWEAIITRISGWADERSFPAEKLKRFRADSIPEDFVNRQLTDTGWAARSAAASLRRLWPDTGATGEGPVETVRGQMTALMRRLWELNDLLSDDGQKNRDDHRHHAVDALVVACLDRRATQALGTYWAARDTPESGVREPVIPRPWPSIREDAASRLRSLVVSHKVTGRKLSGPLHKETVYGDTGEDVIKKGVLYRRVVGRKSVAGLTDNELKENRDNRIRDERVREIVASHIAANGGKPKKAFATFPRVSENGPEIRKVRVIDVRQPSVMMETATGFVALGNNHHIALYQQPDGKGTFEVVSLLTARQRLARRESVVRRERDDGARFVLSLCQGEAFEYLDGERRGVWIVTSVWDSGRVVLKRHDDASGDEKKLYRPGVTGLLPLILDGRGRKVSIDPIGRVRPARD
ncbi:hypothetical protein IHV25_01655 [Phaeovibrio sulfidiphilus]|uniref:RuvC endonuclease subdomain 3 domain-containing protein n=1 Tax=Phaeovibrio sulfidiphilus TaxID=1220600 RepID=A0A8J6YTY2_9PROT|nr:hypothetical protein [Phaeovibrio sulfidiphilus]